MTLRFFSTTVLSMSVPIAVLHDEEQGGVKDEVP